MNMNEPKLRFKADDGSQFPDWEEKKLNEIAVRITRKNKDNVTDIPLTISSADGLIDQRDFFNKVVASKDMSGYYLLKNGEFAYNKSYSKGYDFGSIKRLDLYDEGALSTLYICFALNENENSDFYQKYFDSLSWYPELQKICAEGARNHGLLNVPTNDFFELKLCVPSSEQEQQKIAEFLSTIDTVIAKQKETVSAWEERKKGVMQKLFSQEVRFRADDGSEFPEWEKKKLEDVVEFLDGQRKPLEAGQRVSGKYPYYGASGIIDYVEDYIFDEELILLSEDGANILDRNYRVCFLAKGKYWVNNHAHVLRAMDGNVNGFICEQLESFDYRKYNSGGAQPKLNQATCRAIIMNMPSLPEQQKIADCLSSLDEVIEKQKATLAAWEELKKGLLQQMFA